MQSLFEIAQISDEAFRREMSVHTSMDNTKQVQDAIAELTDDYMDDAEMICDTILDTSFIDGNQFWTTFKAMVNAYALNNEASMNLFAKRLSLEVIAAVQKRAEWKVTK
jgi:methylphosphotriester-DNA--protein-cysteine methyltransferase